MTTSCPACGAALPEAAVRFCVACGRPLPAAAEDTGPAHAADRGRLARPPRAGPPPARRNMVLGLVALVILAGGGTGAYLMLRHKSAAVTTSHSHKTATRSVTQEPASSAAPSSEQDQLTRFLAAVRGSAAARTLVSTAVTQVGACSLAPAAGISQLHQAITDRQNVLAMMSGLSVSAIPGGQSMRADLGNVLQLSISADRDFIGWMQDPQATQDCPASTARDSDYAAGLTASSQAVRAKKQFLAFWNPLAGQFQLPTYATLDI